MTSEVVAVLPGTPIEEVARVMTERKIGGVHDGDAERRPIGIITEGNLYLGNKRVPYSGSQLSKRYSKHFCA